MLCWSMAEVWKEASMEQLALVGLFQAATCNLLWADHSPVVRAVLWAGSAFID